MSKIFIFLATVRCLAPKGVCYEDSLIPTVRRLTVGIYVTPECYMNIQNYTNFGYSCKTPYGRNICNFRLLHGYSEVTRISKVTQLLRLFGKIYNLWLLRELHEYLKLHKCLLLFAVRHLTVGIHVTPGCYMYTGSYINFYGYGEYV